MTYLLGIDIGTSGVKAGLYSSDGCLEASAKSSYSPLHTVPEKMEHDPNAWIEGIRKTVSEILSKVSPHKLAALGLSGLNGLVLANSKGEPVRKVILYTDARSAHQANWLMKNVGSEKFAAITGNRIAPGTFTLPLLLWVRDEEPGNFSKVDKFFAPSGYVGYLLTGQATMEWSRASMTLLFDIRHRGWSDDLLAASAIPRHILPDLVPPWEIIGKVSMKGSASTGLPEGLPVVAGGMDSLCSALGAGMAEPGIAIDIGGSAGGIATCSRKPGLNPIFLNVCHIVPDLWAHIGPMNAAGISLEWLRNVAYAPEDGFEQIESSAAEVGPGSHGLLFLPYLLGERCPIWNPRAKGVLFGLTPAHGRAEIARSVLEGVALGLRHIIETFEENGIPIAEIRAIGGGSSSHLWRQIKANVAGKPVSFPVFTETATLGAAVLAGYGVGLFQDIYGTVREFVKISHRTSVVPEINEIYSRQYVRFRQLYEALKPLFLN